jgi:hypothetical protein
MRRHLLSLSFVLAVAGCTSTSLEERACRQIRETADCTWDGDSEEALMACIEGFEALAAENEAIGCGAEFDALLECYGRTSYRCSGENFPGCRAESDAWLACCSADGMTCPM